MVSKDFENVDKTSNSDSKLKNLLLNPDKEVHPLVQNNTLQLAVWARLNFALQIVLEKV